MQKALKNIWDESLHLELDTRDPGKLMRHESLPIGAEIVVEEEELTDQVRALAKVTRRRKKARLSITDVKSPAEESEDPEEESGEWICPECDREFETERGLTQHMRSHEKLDEVEAELGAELEHSDNESQED